MKKALLPEPYNFTFRRGSENVSTEPNIIHFHKKNRHKAKYPLLLPLKRAQTSNDYDKNDFAMQNHSNLN